VFGRRFPKAKKIQNKLCSLDKFTIVFPLDIADRRIVPGLFASLRKSHFPFVSGGQREARISYSDGVERKYLA